MSSLLFNLGTSASEVFTANINRLTRAGTTDSYFREGMDGSADMAQDTLVVFFQRVKAGTLAMESAHEIPKVLNGIMRMVRLNVRTKALVGKRKHRRDMTEREDGATAIETVRARMERTVSGECAEWLEALGEWREAIEMVGEGYSYNAVGAELGIHPKRLARKVAELRESAPEWAR